MTGFEDAAVGLPAALVRNLHSVWPAEAPGWIEQLPSLIRECEKRWSITVQPAFPNLSFNYVAPITLHSGEQAVLKLGIPRDEYTWEIEALRYFGGSGAVRLLQEDAQIGAMLIERAVPGATLTALASDARDAVATSAVVGVMRRLHRPLDGTPTHPTVADWAAGMDKMRPMLEGRASARSLWLVDRAREAFSELLASSAEPVLLHGDLHHDNIVSTGEGGWVAIDPQGVLGEPAYEVGAVLRNLWQDQHIIPDRKRTLHRRAAQLADELGVDLYRVRAWGFAQAVLSAWWSVESGDENWTETMEFAEMLLPD